jgi:integrase
VSAIPILTAARSQEAIKAEWSETDLNAGLWVPAHKIKMKRTNKVPLSSPALDVLTRAPSMFMSDRSVFPGQSKGLRCAPERSKL